MTIAAFGAGCDRAATSPKSGPSPSAAITLTKVDVPSSPEGDVSLVAHVTHADLGSAALDVEVSLDKGATWKSAHVVIQTLLPDPNTPTEGSWTGSWSSLSDVSFHGPASTTLRLTPRDTNGRGAAFLVALTVDNLKAASRRVNFPMFSYGEWDASAVAIAKRHDLVVLHPGATGVTRALVQDIQRGQDPLDPADDVIVLGYISVGEDDRVSSLTDAQARADARFRGDGSGPRVDPRGPTSKGGALSGIDPLGKVSPGGTGWASYYLDDNSLARDGKGDGVPDRNSNFGGYFVNAGDPKWFDVISQMTLDGPDQSAGLAEILTPGAGRGLGCDGVFLDTIDTAAPNSWTSPSDVDFTQFEWTAPGLSALVARIHATYPSQLVLQNRGDFFFDPALPHFAFTTRGQIDFFLFESYRLSSSTTDGIDPLFFADNQFDIAPKLMAESQRTDGFRALSVGYVEGTGLANAAATLQGKGSVALDSLLEDIRVTERIAGFRHYLTDATLTLNNTFVRDHASVTDVDPPAWSSVWNTNTDAQGLPSAPTARVGLQSVVPGTGRVTVQWDVALDFNHVSYALYAAKTAFDFAGDPALEKATRVVLTPREPAAYKTAFGQATLPFEDTVSGLDSGVTYWFVLRAFDSAGNEERNIHAVSTKIL